MVTKGIVTISLSLRDILGMESLSCSNITFPDVQSTASLKVNQNGGLTSDAAFVHLDQIPLLLE